MRCIVRSLFIVREGRKKRVRLVQDNDSKVQIRIVNCFRDAKTGKMKYETVESVDVVEAKPEEVTAVIRKAISGAK